MVSQEYLGKFNEDCIVFGFECDWKFYIRICLKYWSPSFLQREGRRDRESITIVFTCLRPFFRQDWNWFPRNIQGNLTGTVRFLGSSAKFYNRICLRYWPPFSFAERRRTRDRESITIVFTCLSILPSGLVSQEYLGKFNEDCIDIFGFEYEIGNFILGYVQSIGPSAEKKKKGS